MTLSLVAVPSSQSQSDEDLAKRQLQNGRLLASRGDYEQALKDFRAITDVYATTSVADNAWLEIARYYLDVADDPAEASGAADVILNKYPSSDAAPWAYLLRGEIPLARSRAKKELAAAQTTFDRVPAFFPQSDAVPRALYLAAEASRYQSDPRQALERYARIQADYPLDRSTASAHVGAGLVFAAQGDAMAALEEFQRARNAAAALSYSTILYRLYVRAVHGDAFVFAPEETTRAQDVRALKATPAGGIYYVAKSASLLHPSPRDPAPPAVTKPRGLALDRAGHIAVLDGGAVRQKDPRSIALALPRGGTAQPKPLTNLQAAVSTRSGDWLVADDDERGIHRFTGTGKYVGAYSTLKPSRMAIDDFDDVAVIDSDVKGITILDPDGKTLATIPQKRENYEMRNPVDLTFDTLGHLYVLDRVAVFVFRQSRPQQWSLVTVFSQKEGKPGALRDAKAFTLDNAGRMYIADDHAQRIQLYR